MHTTPQIVCIYMHNYSASGTPTHPLKHGDTSNRLGSACPSVSHCLLHRSYRPQVYNIYTSNLSYNIILKAIESTRHGKMKMNQFLIEHLGIQKVVVVILIFQLT